MRGVESTLITGETLLQVTVKPSLACTRFAAMWTCNGQVAVFLMLMKLGLAWEYALAAIAPEVITVVMRLQSSNIRSVKVAANLQTVLVCFGF